MVLDVSSRYRTPISSNDGNNIVNFVDAFQEKDLNVENLIFEKKDKNNKIEDEDRVIKNEK